MGSDDTGEVVRDVVRDAIRRAGKAHALGTQLRDRLGRAYNHRTVSAWARGDAMPPGDVLLAVAQATGISLDEKLGIGREPSELEREIAELRTQMADLESRLDQLEAQAEGGEAGGSA